jgi:hypothetical protein
MGLLAVADLTANERRLCEAAAAGYPLDLRTGQAGEDDPGQGSTWDSDRRIRAQLLLQLLSGRGDLDMVFGSPVAVRVRGAAVVESLELRLLTLRCPLELVGCHVADKLDLTKARALDLNFRGSHLNGMAGRRLSVAHDVDLRNCRCSAEILLSDAHIGGRLDFSNGQLTNPTGPALCGDGLTVDGDVFLRVRASGSGEKGTIRLLGAHIGGQLVCSNAQLINPSGPALHGDGLTVDGGLFLTPHFSASGSGENGTIRLLRASIGGQLDCSGAQLTNPTGPALHGDGLTVDGDLVLRDNLTATGSSEDGTIRLLGAHIGGQLDCSGAQLTNSDGPALHGDELIVDGGLFLAGQFIATGSGEDGAIRLLGARIRGQLTCSGAQLTNPTGPALNGDGLTVDGDIYFTDQFTASGSGRGGTIRLLGAHIGGQFGWLGAQLGNKQGPVLLLRDSTLSALTLAPGVVTEGAWSVDFSDLVYSGIPKGEPLEQWLTLLMDHTPEYSAQSWQQLAAVHRAAGHERDARTILIAQQDDRRRRFLRPKADTKARARVSLWGYRTYLSLLKLAVGYGYQTWRALIALLLILAAAAGLGLLAGHSHINAVQYVAGRTKATDTASTSNQGRPCSTVEQIGLGVDVALPLIKTNVRTRCDLDSTTVTGQWITAGSWFLQALSWGAATLVIAGYTAVVRRT